MSLFPSPASIFSGTVDYPAAQVLVKEMVSYINSQGVGCCQSKSNQDVLNKVAPILLAMQYDSSDELDNTVRWQTDVQVSYTLLYPLT